MDFYAIIEHIEDKYDFDAYNYKGCNFVEWVVNKGRDFIFVHDERAPLPIREILYLIAKEYAPIGGILPINLGLNICNSSEH